MLVSVIIPSYNHRTYIAQAIGSVLDQSWSPIDLIVIDDGSTDGSPEVIEQLLHERGGFRFVARENRGLLKTLNEGLALARGEFFCELASDDYFPLESLGKRACYLLEHRDCVAVFGDGFKIVNEAVVSPSLLEMKHRQMLLSSNPIPEMLKGNLPVFSTGLIRRDALLQIGGFDDQTFRYYEDLDTPILLALQGPLGFVDTQVICRREHETNVSRSTNHVRVEKVLCYQKFLSDPRFAEHRGLLRMRLRRSLLALGRYLANTGKRSKREVAAMQLGWKFAWYDVGLLCHLLKIRFSRSGNCLD
ncbi:alpha-1,3-rhamnosyltransferase [Geobacteraceae bacterium]|nr:alpha-1,3-rhamnosyltransferase [Geobacteraceae bacterium]